MVRALIDGQECRKRVEWALSSLQPGVSGGADDEMKLYATLAAALFNTKGPGPEACAAWTDALAIAERLDHAEYRLRALWGLWYNHISNGECQAALTLARRFCTLPPDQADPADLLTGERACSETSLYYLGDLMNARRHLDHVLQSLCGFDTPIAYHPLSIRPSRGHTWDTLREGRLGCRDFRIQALRLAQDNLEDARAIDRVISISLYWALDAACWVALRGQRSWQQAERSVGTLLEHSVKQALGFWQALGHSQQRAAIDQARRCPHRGAMSA